MFTHRISVNTTLFRRFILTNIRMHMRMEATSLFFKRQVHSYICIRLLIRRAHGAVAALFQRWRRWTNVDSALWAAGRVLYIEITIDHSIFVSFCIVLSFESLNFLTVSLSLVHCIDFFTQKHKVVSALIQSLHIESTSARWCFDIVSLCIGDSLKLGCAWEWKKLFCCYICNTPWYDCSTALCKPCPLRHSFGSIHY